MIAIGERFSHLTNKSQLTSSTYSINSKHCLEFRTQESFTFSLKFQTVSVTCNRKESFDHGLSGWKHQSLGMIRNLQHPKLRIANLVISRSYSVVTCIRSIKFHQATLTFGTIFSFESFYREAFRLCLLTNHIVLIKLN